MDEEQKYTRLCSQVRTQRGSVKLTVAMQRIWGRGGAQKKRPLFSYVWLQEVHLKLQPVRWARKCVTRPVVSGLIFRGWPSSLFVPVVAIFSVGRGGRP